MMTYAGYRDILVNLRVKNDLTRKFGLELHICELQVLTRPHSHVCSRMLTYAHVHICELQVLRLSLLALLVHKYKH